MDARDVRDSIDDDFFIDLDDEDEAGLLDEPEDVETLAGARLRRKLLIRRNALRSRSYLLIVGIVLALGAVRLLYTVVTDALVAGWTLRPITFVALAAAALLGAWTAFRRAAAESRLYAAAAPPEPDHEPSFEGLGDGAAPPDRRLEEM